MGMSYCKFVALQAALLFYPMTCTHASYWTYLNRFNVKPLDNDSSDGTFTVTEGTSFSECLYPSDCQVVQKCGHNKSAVYRVFPFGVGKGFPAYCDMVTNGGGWLVFQRRQDGTEDFFRNWQSYKDGFGNLYQEFWLGLDKIHLLTSQRHYELLINLENFEGQSRHAAYSRFRTSGEKDKFRLMVEVIQDQQAIRCPTTTATNLALVTETTMDGWGYVFHPRPRGLVVLQLSVQQPERRVCPCQQESNVRVFRVCRIYLGKKFGNMQYAEMKVRPVGSP